MLVVFTMTLEDKCLNLVCNIYMTCNSLPAFETPVLAIHQSHINVYCTMTPRNRLTNFGLSRTVPNVPVTEDSSCKLLESSFTNIMFPTNSVTLNLIITNESHCNTGSVSEYFVHIFCLKMMF